MEKIGIGINLRFQRMDGRVWFEVTNTEPEIKRFDRTCNRIDLINHVHDWKSFIAAVELLFSKEGFLRIAK